MLSIFELLKRNFYGRFFLSGSSKGMNMPQTKKYRQASISRINKKAFWNLYDHAGRLLVMNFISIILILTVLGIPVALIGMYGVTRKIVNYEDSGANPLEFRDYWASLRKFWIRSLKITLLMISGLILLIINIYFYNLMLTSPEIDLTLNLILSVMLGLMLWIFIFFLIFCSYIYPVLVQLDLDVKATLKNSFFLMMDNLKASFFLLFNLLGWTIFGITTGILGLFFSLAIICIIGNTTVRELLAQYQVHGLDNTEEVRGLRDLFKPWEYS